MSQFASSRANLLGNSPEDQVEAATKARDVPPVAMTETEPLSAVPPSPASDDSMGSIPDDSSSENEVGLQDGLQDGLDSVALDIDYESVEAAFREEHISELATQVSALLQDIVDRNDRIPFNADRLTRFHSRAPPGISIRDYLMRIIKFCSLDKAILLVLLYFVDLFSQSYSHFNLNTLTVHRFLITAATVATKGLCDQFCSNTHYAKVGGISVVELNLLEVEFLTRVNYRIVASSNLFWQYYLKSQEKPGTPYSSGTASPTRKHAREEALAKGAATGSAIASSDQQSKPKGLKAMRETFRFLHSAKKKKENETSHA